MSIGIGITLPDGILLVADGNKSMHFVKGAPVINNNIDKIIQISETIFAVPFGITYVTDLVIEKLLHNISSIGAIEDIEIELNISMITSWELFVKLLDPKIDRNHPTMRAAFLVGGIFDHVPFITSSLIGTRVKPQVLTHKQPNFKIVFGGEEQNALNLLTYEYTKVLNNVAFNERQGPRNSYIKKILISSQKVIRLIESQNPHIGGTLRYAIIRTNYEVEKKILKGKLL